jgi:hypothetical protein
MSADGTPVTEPRLITTHVLLTSEDFEDCLGSSSSFISLLVCLFVVFLFCSLHLMKFSIYVLQEK